MTTRIVTLFAMAGLATAADKIQSYPLTGLDELVLQNVKAEAVEYQGRKAVRLTRDSEKEGFALVKNASFQDGVIEADLAVKITLPPGVRMPGFIGIAFRARPDASHYDLFYLRPGNSQSENQTMRNHSVQYTAAPDFGWNELRRAWPSAYESWADLQFETWTKVKIEVSGRSARLYVNGSAKPSLIVDAMKGEDLSGAIALWPYPGEEAYFSNLRITPSAPKQIKNGGDATGTWEFKSTTDSEGPVNGSMKLQREGNKVAGTWSGPFGADQPVKGTWRNGYVELTLSGIWPKDRPGTQGNVSVSLAGWIDDNSATGRMRIDGRADGQWSATRRE